jgi:hypothetical protein
MLIVALSLAVLGFAALVAAVVSSNEFFAWACIGLSAFGVLLLIVDAVRDHSRSPESRGLAQHTRTGPPSPDDDYRYADDLDEHDDDRDDHEDDRYDFVDDLSEYDLHSDDKTSYPIAAVTAVIPTVTDWPSDIATESPTVSYADNTADDTVVVIYSSETESDSTRGPQGRGGQR